jgi:hypothetical protein
MASKTANAPFKIEWDDGFLFTDVDDLQAPPRAGTARD